MATGKEIRISIKSALDAAGIEATKSQVSDMSKSVQKSLGEMAAKNRTHWADIKAAWDMGCAAIGKTLQALKTALQSAFKFETQTTQFKTLIGDIDEAKAHMADLKELGDSPPFSLDQFAEASRSLMVMSDGVLGFKSSLKLVGDAAAATGHPIEEMGQAVGRLYSFIRDGQPISRAVMQLRNMGVITPEVAQKLQDMQKEGKSNAEIWEEVEKALGRYSGAMEETEKTGEGLMSAIKSRWDNIVRAFGKAWSDSAKEGMQTALDKMKEIEEDGTLEVWAKKVAEAIHEAVEAVKALHGELNAVGDGDMVDMFDRSRSGGDNADHSVGQFIGNALTQLGAFGAYARGLFVPGENAFNNYLAYGALHGYGGWSDAAARKFNERMRASGEWTEDMDIRAVEEKRIEDIKVEAAKKIAKEKEIAEKEAEQRVSDEKMRIQDDLSNHQKKIDEENAKAAAEARAKEEEKAMRRSIQNLRREQRLQNERDRDAQDRLKKADENFKQAWEYYKDPNALYEKKRADEEEADLRKQFERDFEDLKRRTHGDWRNAENLSIQDEAIRGVALAQEDKETASQWAEATATATKECADTLNRLEQLLHEAGGE